MKLLVSLVVAGVLAFFLILVLLTTFSSVGILQMREGSTGLCLSQKTEQRSASRAPCIRALAIAEAASLLASHVHGNPGVWYDAGMPQEAIAYWRGRCPAGSSCWSYWQNGNLQCVQLVTAAFAMIGEPLPAIGNALDFWKLYESRPGWKQIAFGGGQPSALPFPGDILVWENEGLGHVAIVTEMTPPQGGKNGSVSFAQANGPGSLISQPILPDGTVATWKGYRVLGSLRASEAFAPLPPLVLSQQAAEVPSASSASKEFYVALAGAEAQKNQLPPDRFIKQIALESAFDSAAISPAGAIGIAQFMPATAAELGINPYDPVASLEAAAALMASYIKAYSGDYAKALAAYHAGPGAVAGAIRQCGDAWLSCLTTDTQWYVTHILADELPSQQEATLVAPQVERRYS